MKSYLALEKSLSMSDAQGRHGGPALEPYHVEGAGDEDRGDHRRHDAKDQSDSKTLYRASAELKQEERGQDHAHVRVHDGIHRVAETFVHCQPVRLAVNQLLAHSLEYENVVINGQPDGKHDAGQPW